MKSSGSYFHPSSLCPHPFLQWDIAVLFRRVLVPLVAGHRECRDELTSREARLDDLVDVSPLGRDERIGELFLVLVDLLLPIARRLIKNAHRPLGSHDRDLRR